MFGIKTGIYWRICWAIITPGIMALVLIYTLIEYKPLTYKNIEYPTLAYGKYHNKHNILNILNMRSFFKELLGQFTRSEYCNYQYGHFTLFISSPGNLY